MESTDPETVEMEEYLRTPHVYCDSLPFVDLVDKLEKVSKTGATKEKVGFILNQELYQKLHEK